MVGLTAATPVTPPCPLAFAGELRRRSTELTTPPDFASICSPQPRAARRRPVKQPDHPRSPQFLCFHINEVCRQIVEHTFSCSQTSRACQTFDTSTSCCADGAHAVLPASVVGHLARHLLAVTRNNKHAVIYTHHLL